MHRPLLPMKQFNEEGALLPTCNVLCWASHSPGTLSCTVGQASPFPLEVWYAGNQK